MKALAFLVIALGLGGCLLDHFEEKGKGRKITIDCRDRNLHAQDSLHDTTFTCDLGGPD